MPIQIPLIPNEFNYTVSTVLGDDEYIFDVRWNGRDSAWYFDLYDVAGDLIRAGIKIVLGTPLGARVSDARFPDGLFLASDLSNTGVDAAYEDLGERVVLFFYENSEL